MPTWLTFILQGVLTSFLTIQLIRFATRFFRGNPAELSTDGGRISTSRLSHYASLVIFGFFGFGGIWMIVEGFMLEFWMMIALGIAASVFFFAFFTYTIFYSYDRFDVVWTNQWVEGMHQSGFL